MISDRPLLYTSAVSKAFMPKSYAALMCLMPFGRGLMKERRNEVSTRLYLPPPRGPSSPSPLDGHNSCNRCSCSACYEMQAQEDRFRDWLTGLCEISSDPICQVGRKACRFLTEQSATLDRKRRSLVRGEDATVAFVAMRNLMMAGPFILRDDGRWNTPLALYYVSPGPEYACASSGLMV